jgi:DNA invertase Pin-like site-specific DNA recombinase
MYSFQELKRMTIARKDYTDCLRRQNQGIIKAKEAGLYKGRKEDIKRNASIMEMLSKGVS